MSVSLPAAAEVEAFIARWGAGDGGQERANYALFLTELCDLIGAPRPDQASHDATANAYAFERAVTFREPDGSKSLGRIDLYKRGAVAAESGLLRSARNDGSLARLGHARTSAGQTFALRRRA